MGIVTWHKAKFKYLVYREIMKMKEAKLTQGWEKLFPVNGGT